MIFSMEPNCQFGRETITLQQNILNYGKATS